MRTKMTETVFHADSTMTLPDNVIRAMALECASETWAGMTMVTLSPREDVVVETAKRFERYIAEGS